MTPALKPYTHKELVERDYALPKNSKRFFPLGLPLAISHEDYLRVPAEFAAKFREVPTEHGYHEEKGMADRRDAMFAARAAKQAS